MLLYYIIIPLYAITWLPICIQAFLNRNSTEWSHTIHTRSLDISDLEKTSLIIIYKRWIKHCHVPPS